MDIIISNSNGKPIYEQISSQVRAQILSGALEAGERLPSIRALADGLGVSVITTKRAYSDLEGEGLVETVQGKGCFVSPAEQGIASRTSYAPRRRSYGTSHRGGEGYRPYARSTS